MLLYGENTTTFGVLADILVLPPSSNNYRLQSLICWGDAAGEWILYKNGVVIAGCRTSDSKRTEQVWWGDTFISDSTDTITISATHYSSGVRALKCNLELDRLS